MTRARNIAGFSTITTTPSPVNVGPIGVLTATRIDGAFGVVDLDTRDITAQGIGVTNLQVSGITTGLNVSGIITAQNGINFNGTSTGLNVSGVGTIATLSVTGNATVGGVLTYEDVTRVDSVGVITAREQVHVGTGVSIAAGGLNVTAGITTVQALQATTGIITGTAAQLELVGNEGVSAALRLTADQGDDNGDGWEIRSNQDDNDLTFKNDTSGSYVDKLTLKNNGDLHILDKIIHDGDTNTAIRFPAADTVTVETAGAERLRITSDGQVGIGTAPETNANLHVMGSGRGRTIIHAGGTESAQLWLRNPKGTWKIHNYYDGDALTFTDDSNERLRIDSSGFITQTFSSNNSTEAEGLFINNKDNSTGVNASLIFSCDSGSRKKASISYIDTGAYGTGDMVFALDNDADSGALHVTNHERMRITKDGKVGINITDNTTADLHVRTGNSGAGIFRIGGSTGGGTGLDINYSNSGSTKTIIKQNYRATNAGAELSYDSGFHTFMVGTNGNTEALRILSNSRVGINTASTNRQITIKDDAGGGVGILGGNAGIYMGMHSTGGFQVNAAIARAAAANYHITGSAIGDLCVSAESTKDIIIGHSVNAGAMAEAMRVHHNGFITRGSQNPCFHARGLANNSTGAKTDDANVDAVFGTINLNTGSDYSNSNGRFTAPVSGHYFFGCSLLIDDNANTNSTYHFTFFKNNSFYARAGYDYRISDRSGYYGPHMSNTCVVYLAENDYMTVRMDTAGFHTGSEANFCGFLIG